jgi:hypothetical protein
MSAQAIKPSMTDEKVLLNIARRLPPERVSQLIDFARFLEFQLDQMEEDDWLEDESQEEIEASKKNWDELLARPEAQRLMEQMALEALAEEEAGLTVEMDFDDEGNLIDPK